jgi:hypothetical protein
LQWYDDVADAMCAGPDRRLWRERDPAPCSEVAAHELAVMGFLPPAIKLAIESRCRDDQWSVDARRCIVTATGFDEMSACYDKLTAAQRAAYQHILRGSDDVPDTAPPTQPELLK